VLRHDRTTGAGLQQIVPAVTTHDARMVGMEDELGRLCVRAIADVSVLADDRGRFRLSDNEGTEEIAGRLLRPLFCLRAGRRHDAAAPILPQAISA
jgi:dihydroorotase